MIYDHIDNIGLYRFGAATMKAFEFLKTLTPDSPDATAGRTPRRPATV